MGRWVAMPPPGEPGPTSASCPRTTSWPDDLLPFLERARERMLAGPAPSPSPEVLAYLEEPAYGKVDGDGTMVLPVDPEPFELEALSGPLARTSSPPGGRRRRRCGPGPGRPGPAACADVLAARGERAGRSPRRRRPPSRPPRRHRRRPRCIGSLDVEVPADSAGADVDGRDVVGGTPRGPGHRPPAAPTAPASVATPKPTKTTKPTPNRPRPAPAPAPAPVASPSEVVLAYFHAANARGQVRRPPAGERQPGPADRGLRGRAGPPAEPRAVLGGPQHVARLRPAAPRQRRWDRPRSPTVVGPSPIGRPTTCRRTPTARSS